MSYQEDQVISVVSTKLRANEVAGLAEGANQMRAFRFGLPGGRRKSPDLVFLLDEQLFVFEAKVRASELFVAGRDGLSDFDAMRFIAGCELTRAKLIVEARQRLEACGHGSRRVSSIVTGVMAAGSVVARSSWADSVQAIRVDPSTSEWFVEGNTPSYSLAQVQRLCCDRLI